MVISVASQKGGSGKTTVSICIADEFFTRGYDVLLVDADPQKSSLRWRDAANKKDIDIPTVIGVEDNFHDSLPRHLDEYDLVVIDCPPGRQDLERSVQTPRQRSALLLSDLVIIPTGPGVTDLWAIHATTQLIDAANSHRNTPLDARILLNRIRNITRLSDDAKSTLDDYALPCFDATLGQRVAFAETPGTGRGVTRHKSNSKAADELNALADELSTLYPDLNTNE